MKKYLLFLVASFVFDANASFFDEYAENGVCIKIVKNNTKNFTLVPESSAVAIGEREITDEDTKKISKKNISSMRACVSLYGKKESEIGNIDKRIVHLKCGEETLSTLSFHVNGDQLYLDSVKRDAVLPDVVIGMFRETDGGGITYRLIIEESQDAIDVLEDEWQENLVKVEIE